MSQLITGIQQVGIGVTDIDTKWKIYRNAFGTDISVFDDVAEASLMTSYTNDEVHSRRAVLALNLNGGGGFEIWQFKSRTPENPGFKPKMGDLGINAVKLKTKNVEKTWKHLTTVSELTVTEPKKAPDGNLTALATDPNGNRFQIVRGDSWFSKKADAGGVCGVIIGVSDIDAVLPLYQKAFEFNQVIYDETGIFEDLQSPHKFRRILLRKPQKDEGAFSRLFGHVDIELIQLLDAEPRKIYENRLWGDPGFIHVCFDVTDLDRLKQRCADLGYPFTVDSGSTFDMGETSGRFAYIEDPDGTLIEFVQAHKLPLLKKIGWNLDLVNRKEQKPIPDWILRMMRLNRVKE